MPQPVSRQTISQEGLTRQQLFARFRGGPAPIRPPGAGTEARFVDLCTRCDACLSACPSGILVHGRGGFPALDATRGGCTFCGHCAESCQPGALSADLAFDYVATVSAACVETKGVSCRLCSDACDAEAIRFRPALGGRTSLTITADCSGCGACVSRCPVAALSLTPVLKDHAA